LASGSYDGSVRLWDVQESTSRVGIEQAGLISAVAWSPDGTLVASATEEGLVHISLAADGHLLQRFEHAGPVNTLCWSPDGEQLVSGSADGAKGVVSIWDVRQGALVRTLEGHSGFLMGVDWSPQDNMLVSAGTDGTVRWWNPEQGVHLAKLTLVPQPLLLLSNEASCQDKGNSDYYHILALCWTHKIAVKSFFHAQNQRVKRRAF